MKIQLNKSQWQTIGENAGWIKEAQDVGASRYENESIEDFRKRLQKIRPVIIKSIDNLTNQYYELATKVDRIKSELDEKNKWLENIDNFLDNDVRSETLLNSN